MKTVLIVVCMLAAAAAAAQQPKTAPFPVAIPPATPATPAPTPLPAIDSASAASLQSIVTEATTIENQMQPLVTQLQTYNAQLQDVRKRWRIAEGKALANANLDPAAYAVEPTGKTFVSRPQGPGAPRR